MLRLVVRSPRLPGEPLHLHCLRMTALNGLGNLSWLTTLAGLPRSFHSRPCNLRALAALLGGVDPADLMASAAWPNASRAGMVRSFGGGVPARALDVAFPKVCPDCIAERRRCEPVWDLRAYRACAVHGRRMIEACPRCGCALSLYRKAPGRCACGADLASASSPPAGDTLVAVSRVVAGLVRSREAHALSLPDALRLCWFVGTGEIGTSAWRNLYISRPRGAALDRVFEAAAPCLLDWPDAFHRWVSARWRAVPGRTGAGDEYGDLPGRLRSTFEPASPVLREARAAMAANDAGSPTRATSAFHARVENPAVLTSAAAARRLGIAPARMTRLLRAGAVSGGVRAMGRRRLHLVPRREVDRLAGLDAILLTRSAAARLLGTSPFQVEALVRARILTLGHGPKRSGLDAGEIRSLVAGLSRRCGLGSSDTIGLADLAGLRRHRLADVIAAILEGYVPVHVHDASAPGIARFGVQASALAGRRFKVPGAATLGVRQAAACLGVSSRMVTALVRARCLHRAVGVGTRCGITTASVSAFRSDYVMAGELARAAATSTKAVASRLRAAGASPVIGSDLGRGISAVWRRSDVEGRAR